MTIRNKEDFQALEYEWFNRLAGRSLVIEAGIEPESAIEALGVLGWNLANSDGRGRARLFARFPAVLLAGLCAVAANHYDAGTFWPNVPPGLRVDMNRQSETGKAFQAALRRMGLSRFTTPHRYVGEILMHAGIPLSSVDGLVQTIMKWDDGRTSGDAAGFIRWTASMSQPVAVTRGFDVPTYRFLTEGGEIAEDFIERFLAAIDSGGARADLPPAIADAIARALDGVAPRGGQRRRRPSDTAPSLVYDQHFGVKVRLPPLEAEIEAAITWTVLAGGEVQRLLVDAPWPGDPVEPKWVGVRAPQQSVTVSITPGDQRWELPLVDARDPLLVFDGTSGSLIPERVSLPKGIVWIAIPADPHDQPEALLEVDGELLVTERGATPHGWAGWAFFAIDASRLQKLRVASIADRWRYVTSVERPRLTGTADALAHVSTVNGEAVLSARPRLLLPGPRGDAQSIEWTVVVEDQQGAEVSRVVHRVAETQEVDLLLDDQPQLGLYRAVVRGPLGRGATVRFALAEKVTISASTQFRWMTERGDGLESATVSLSGEGLSDPINVELGRTDRVGKSVLRRGKDELSLVIEIPYLAVGTTSDETEGDRIVPLTVDRESLLGVSLRVRIPAGSGAVYLSAVLGGTVLQTLEGSGGWGSPVRSFALATLA